MIYRGRETCKLNLEDCREISHLTLNSLEIGAHHPPPPPPKRHGKQTDKQFGRRASKRTGKHANMLEERQ